MQTAAFNRMWTDNCFIIVYGALGSKHAEVLMVGIS